MIMLRRASASPAPRCYARFFFFRPFHAGVFFFSMALISPAADHFRWLFFHDYAFSLAIVAAAMTSLRHVFVAAILISPLFRLCCRYACHATCSSASYEYIDIIYNNTLLRLFHHADMYCSRLRVILLIERIRNTNTMPMNVPYALWSCHTPKSAFTAFFRLYARRATHAHYDFFAA